MQWREFAEDRWDSFKESHVQQIFGAFFVGVIAGFIFAKI